MFSKEVIDAFNSYQAFMAILAQTGDKQAAALYLKDFLSKVTNKEEEFIKYTFYLESVNNVLFLKPKTIKKVG